MRSIVAVKRKPVALQTVVVALAVACAGLGWWAFVRPPERVEVPVEVADAGAEAEIRLLEEAVAERDTEVSRLMLRVAELETSLEAARRSADQAPPPSEALLACRQERDGLAAGLRRAVDELNNQRITISGVGGAPPLPATPQSGAAAPIPRSGVPQAAGGGPRPYRKVSSYGERIQILGSDAMVSGRLYNPDQRDQQIRVELAVLRDGAVVDSGTQTVLVPGRGYLTVTQRLRAGTSEGTYGARVRVLE